MRRKQRIALVTGASKGVGRGIALGLAAADWDVIVNYNRDAKGARETAAAIRAKRRKCWVMHADVGNSRQVRAMFAKISRLDLLVNNAGVQTWSPLLKLRERDWERTIRTNLTGMFLCTQQAALRMRRQGGGCIINIGSGANKAPFPNLVDYCASKGGIEAFTRVVSVELGPHKIRVNCVAPGCIEIERTKKESPDYAATWSPLTPLRRIGRVDDVAGAVVFLAGDDASFITGQTLYVDGIDVYYLGPEDISNSLGIPGQSKDPRVVKIVEDSIRKIVLSGKMAGCIAADTATARRYVELGARYIASHAIRFMANGSRQFLNEVKA